VALGKERFVAATSAARRSPPSNVTSAPPFCTGVTDAWGSDRSAAATIFDNENWGTLSADEATASPWGAVGTDEVEAWTTGVDDMSSFISASGVGTAGVDDWSSAC